MRILVKNRNTGAVSLDLDVNSEGNVHELILEHRGSRFVVSGANWSPGIYVSASPSVQLEVHPQARDEIHVQAMNADPESKH